jgi:hypothetical protein
MWVKGARNEQKIHEHVVPASQTLFRLCKDLKVLAVGVSQLTNDAAKRKETPVAQDLYGGMPLVADADQVVIPDHSRTRPVQESTHLGGRAIPYATGHTEGVFGVPKNRHGPSTVEVSFLFDRNNLRMTERVLREGEKW